MLCVGLRVLGLLLGSSQTRVLARFASTLYPTRVILQSALKESTVIQSNYLFSYRKAR